MDGGWSCAKQCRLQFLGGPQRGATHGPLTVEPPCVRAESLPQESVGPCGVQRCGHCKAGPAPVFCLGKDTAQLVCTDPSPADHLLQQHPSLLLPFVKLCKDVSRGATSLWDPCRVPHAVCSLLGSSSRAFSSEGRRIRSSLISLIRWAAPNPCRSQGGVILGKGTLDISENTVGKFSREAACPCPNSLLYSTSWDPCPENRSKCH